MATAEQKRKERDGIIEAVLDDAMRLGAALGSWLRSDEGINRRAGRSAMDAARSDFASEIRRVIGPGEFSDDEPKA